MFGLSDKISAIGASVIAVGLGVALLFTNIELRQAEADRDTYKNRIENQETGYIVRLATCRDSQALLEREVARQNDRVDEMAAESRRRVEAAEDARAKAQLRAAEFRASLERLENAELPEGSASERCLQADQIVTRELGE